MRICIVTCDIVGPVKNGGIGTAYTALAEVLARAGHDVTILFALGTFSEGESAERCVDRYRRSGVRFVPLERDPFTRAPDFLAVAWDVHRWLVEERFDLVHVHEWRGPGFYALLARAQGLAYADTRFVVGLHSPSTWHDRNNGLLLDEPDDLALDFMERESVRLADILVSPSRYLLDWAKSEGWVLPKDVRVAQNLQPEVSHAGTTAPVREIVFFGRLETRKGLELFCAALDRLQPTVQVTFLGKHGEVAGVKSQRWLSERGRGWRFDVSVLSGLDRRAAGDYLAQAGRLAVIPSLADNSPYTVLECLAAEIPFIASAVGGIGELVAEEDRPRVLFAPEPAALASALANAIAGPLSPARPAVSFEETERTWRALHSEPIALEPRRSPASEPPFISVCLVHHDRPSYLRQALASLREQTYQRFEVVLVDDGSTTSEARALLDELETEFAERGWTLVRQANLYQGAARNAAVGLARGDWLLFMDDDNVARRHELEVFARVSAATDADVITCQMELFEGDHPTDPPLGRWLFTGGPVALGAFRNCFGDSNALWRRSTFLALGGFDERRQIGLEDWQLLARAALSGATMATIPEALYWYRVSAGGLRLSTRGAASELVALKPYLEAVPTALRTVVEVARGAEIRRQEEQTRAALAKLDVGALLGRLSERLQEHPTLLRAARFCKSLLRR